MGRKSDIRAEISALEGKISEYQSCINDLIDIKSRVESKYWNMDSDYCSDILKYDIHHIDKNLGARAENSVSQKDDHVKISNSYCEDLDGLIQNIYRAIHIYEEKIDSCRESIRTLSNELEAILESE